MSKIVILLILK